MPTSIANGETGISCRGKLNHMLGMVNNVKDFGAVGDGSTDDTAAIQAAIDDAYGAAASPHGITTPYNNKAVYFPNGKYKVVPSIQRTITNAVNNAGKIQLTLSGLGTSGMNVKQAINVSGVVGTTEANNTWFYTIDSGTQITLLNSTFTHAYTSGGTLANAALNFYAVQGAKVFGGGRFATTIFSNVTSGMTISCNGVGYSSFSDMEIQGSPSGVAFDLNWDNVAVQSTQSNSFRDMFFDGVSNAGFVGLQIGAGGFQCSENLIENCFFSGLTIAGLSVRNFNALAQTVIGGDFQSCAIGIWVNSGSAPVIHGTAFQGQTDTDIAVDNQAGDCYSISGCRTESTNFCRFGNGPSANIGACIQAAATSGTFVQMSGGAGGSSGAPGGVTIDSCWSKNGKITGNGSLYIRGNPSAAAFGNASYLTSFTGTVVQNI